MNKRFTVLLFFTALYVMGLTSCRETPTMPEDNPLDPASDQFELTRPDSVSATFDGTSSAKVTWRDDNELKANRYNIEVFRMDVTEYELFSDTLIELTNINESGDFNKAWRDHDMNALIKGYRVRSLYVNDEDTLSSAWSDTAMVDLFQFDQRLDYEYEMVFVELDYSFPEALKVVFEMDLITDKGVESYIKNELNHDRTNSRITLMPVLSGTTSLSFRSRISVNDDARQWVYFDTLSVDPELIQPPDYVRLTYPRGDTLYVENSAYDENDFHMNRVSIDDCEDNPVFGRPAFNGSPLALSQGEKCYPYKVRIKSQYRFFESDERILSIQKHEISRMYSLSRRLYADHDAQIFDTRSVGNGEMMVGIGRRNSDNRYIAGFWQEGEKAMKNEIILQSAVAPVIGYDSKNSDEYYLLTSDEIRNYRAGNPEESRNHNFEINLSNVDWFYQADKEQRFLLAYENEIRFYDNLTLQPINRSPVFYEKICHLWDHLVLLQDNQDNQKTKVINVLTEEVILSWPQSTIKWQSGANQAGILLSDGTMVRFTRSEIEPVTYTFPETIDRFSVKAILPLSDKNLIFSVIKNEATKLYHYHFQAESEELRELESWNFELSGYHSGWILNDTPSFLLEFEQNEFKFEAEYAYTLED